ncbi:MAG: ARMT1-like domain-containing protein, partial [Cyanobacteria bacterium P01_E01_bin.35]
WNAPLFFWEMPSELRQELAQSSLVVIKGDANYRRLIGDCHWSKTSSFNQITSYFPTACVVSRTLKSELIVGLELNQIEQLNQKDTRWLTNGSRGIIHFAEFAGAD